MRVADRSGGRLRIAPVRSAARRPIGACCPAALGRCTTSAGGVGTSFSGNGRSMHSPERLIGADYRARVRVSDPDDGTLAEIGETCERIPVMSLPWLLEQGLIEPIVTEGEAP